FVYNPMCLTSNLMGICLKTKTSLILPVALALPDTPSNVASPNPRSPSLSPSQDAL
ncbi:hypothetical protein L9F63_018039, partial [Diploptera punctata]